MKDSTRENLSYPGLYAKLLRVKKEIEPQTVSFGSGKRQYFLYYEPKQVRSDKIILWAHGGGWNAGSPKLFDFVGQCIVGNGFRFVSLGYRPSILCYSKKIQEAFDVDLSPVIGFIGVGGPYCFSEKDSPAVRLLLDQLFAKGYDRTQGEPYALMTKSEIPMLLTLKL